MDLLHLAKFSDLGDHPPPRHITQPLVFTSYCFIGIIRASLQQVGIQHKQVEVRAMKSKILLYRSTISLPGDAFEEATVVTSLVSCLHEATEKEHDLIVIMFNLGSLKRCYDTVELCGALKRNRHTMQTPLVCVLPSKRRDLLERLENAGVKYVMISDAKDSALQSRLETFSSNPSEEYKIERILSAVCPHINYFPISRDKEILYCGAYRNRLVIGPYRLRQYCETNNHINCEYFRNPR